MSFVGSSFDLGARESPHHQERPLRTIDGDYSTDEEKFTGTAFTFSFDNKDFSLGWSLLLWLRLKVGYRAR